MPLLLCLDSLCDPGQDGSSLGLSFSTCMSKLLLSWRSCLVAVRPTVVDQLGPSQPSSRGLWGVRGGEEELLFGKVQFYLLLWLVGP